MIIGDLLADGCIAPRVGAASKRQVLSIVAETAGRAFALGAADVFAALAKGERFKPTGVGHGAAIPHARIAGLLSPRAVFLRLEAPVEFEAVDDEPVDLVFTLLAPLGAGCEYLLALARMSRCLRQARLREQLRHAVGVDAIRALLTRENLASAA